MWAALPRARTAHSTHTCVLKAFARPPGWPGTPRSSRLHAGCHHASKEAHAWSGAAGTPETQRGSCVRACLERPRRERSFPVLRLPFWPQKCGGHRLQGGRGLVLQKTRERFQVLSGGSPVLSAPSSCPRACACSHCAAQNPTFRFWTSEDGGKGLRCHGPVIQAASFWGCGAGRAGDHY